MKVYLTDEKELIMELSMKWAGNPNIIIATKTFCLRATVQILVSLIEKPQVDFGLTILGADAMAIPGLYRFVQELINDHVPNMYSWPKYLEVPILNPSKAAKESVGILTVKVLKGSKLKKDDLIGKSDPYVKRKLIEDTLSAMKTTIKHRNLNLEWNEEFNLVVKYLEFQALELIIYDWEQVGKHEKMGLNVVHLKEFIPEEPKVISLNLLKNMEPDDPLVCSYILLSSVQFLNMGIESGSPPTIPPNATLQFDVELVKWSSVKDICKDGGLFKKILAQGEKWENPKDIDEVLVDYEAQLEDGTVVAKSEGVEFTVKEGLFCPALAKAVKTMKKGEKVLFTVKLEFTVKSPILSIHKLAQARHHVDVLREDGLQGDGSSNILTRKMLRRANHAVTKAVVQWRNNHPKNATWGFLFDLQVMYPNCTLEDKGASKGRVLMRGLRDETEGEKEDTEQIGYNREQKVKTESDGQLAVNKERKLN